MTSRCSAPLFASWSAAVFLPGLRKIIGVYGCFWHRDTCKDGARNAETNAGYWGPENRTQRGVCKQIRSRRSRFHCGRFDSQEKAERARERVRSKSGKTLASKPAFRLAIWPDNQI